MAYDPYTETRTLDWTWESQCALWRARALHSAERAEYFRKLSESLRTGSTIHTQKDK
jgi:hypothetical protein